MPTINVPALKHKPGFVTRDGSKWEPYTDGHQVMLLAGAFLMIHKRILENKSVLKTCNASFTALRFGRNFAALWNDPAVWISFNPTPQRGAFASTPLQVPFTKEITIAAKAFTQPDPVAFLAATLVHELAHSNGAPAGESTAAEETLLECGFRDQYDSTIEGRIMRLDEYGTS